MYVCMVKPNWDTTKWSLNRGGLLIEVKMYVCMVKPKLGHDQVDVEERWSLNRGENVRKYGKTTTGTRPSGP